MFLLKDESFLQSAILCSCGYIPVLSGASACVSYRFVYVHPRFSTFIVSFFSKIKEKGPHYFTISHYCASAHLFAYPWPLFLRHDVLHIDFLLSSALHYVINLIFIFLSFVHSALQHGNGSEKSRLMGYITLSVPHRKLLHRGKRPKPIVVPCNCNCLLSSYLSFRVVLTRRFVESLLI